MTGNACYVYLLTNPYRNHIHVGLGDSLNVHTGLCRRQSSDLPPDDCTKLVYFEKHGDSVRARARVELLRRASMVKKLSMIERTNPGWCDLSRRSGVSMQQVCN